MIGFSTIREMAMSIAIFEDFIKAGGNQADQLFKRYGPTLHVDKKTVLGMLEEIIDSVGNISNIIRSGIRHMKLHGKLIVVTEDGEGGYSRLS